MDKFKGKCICCHARGVVDRSLLKNHTLFVKDREMPIKENIHIEIQILFFHDDGTIRRVPFERYDRLIKKNSKEQFPEYANKRIRCAYSAVEFKQELPTKISATSFTVLPFTETGIYDYKAYHEAISSLWNTVINENPLPETTDPDRPNNVIRMDSYIAKNRKRFFEEFDWLPTDKEVQQLKDAIFLKL